jgi:polysaccharide export outer membrane protein
MIVLPRMNLKIICQGSVLRYVQMHLKFAMRFLLFVAALMLLSKVADAQETVGHLAGTLRQLPADNCGCRNIPGGYPCRGACQPCMMGVDCGCGAEQRWTDMKPMDFGSYTQGGYAGPSRLAHLSEYRLRPGDQLQVIYLITRRQKEGSYRLTPGDQVMIDSTVYPDLQRGTLERGLTILPDGTITVRLLGEVHAAGLTVSQLREVLKTQYLNLYDEPAIDVTPVRTNTLADDIRRAVGGASGLNQQTLNLVVMPDGKIRLPGIGEVCVQGFTLSQLKREINLRYGELLVGIDVEPILTAQAPRFVHVLGQVGKPSRVTLDGPTTILGAIASAGGHLPDGNMRQVVVMRRAEDWRLVSTMLDLQGAVFDKRPTPADEIWLRDGDVIIVPDESITRLNKWIRQVFSEGIY